jgi:hypothetical protein
MDPATHDSSLASMVNSIDSAIFPLFSHFQVLPRPTVKYLVADINCNQSGVGRGGSHLGGDWKTFYRLSGVRQNWYTGATGYVTKPV